MNALDFDFEWESPGGARGPELRATWARLTIRVEGRLVTRVWDHRSQGVRAAVYGPLYPLAEWVATNWWVLLQETPAPHRAAARSFHDRHHLRAASEGFALPDLRLIPAGDRLRVEWHRGKAGAQGVTFLDAGVAYLPRATARTDLERFVEGVLERLDNQGVCNTFLAEEWASVREASASVQEFCERAGALGLDPYDLPEGAEAAILNAEGALPASLRDEFFHAAAVRELPDQIDWVRDGLGRISAGETRLARLDRLRNEVSRADSAAEPWRAGYDCARNLRSRLDLPPAPRSVSLDELCGGEAAAALVLNDTGRPRAGFDALVGLNHRGGLGVFVGKPRKESQRFAFGRALFEYLYADQELPALVSAAESDRQKRTRAFAAELFAPAEALREALSGTVVSFEEIDDLAANFEVSPQVIQYQLKNHHLARVLAVG